MEKEKTDSLVDTGSDVTAMAEAWYNQRRKMFRKYPVLPTPTLAVKGAFGGSERRIKREVLCSMDIGGKRIDTLFLVVTGMAMNIVLGSDWLDEHGAIFA